MSAGHDVELAHGDRARAPGPLRMDDGVEGDQRHAHVRGMDGDALIGRARDPEDRVHAILPLERGAAAAGDPLVARPGDVAKIGAARALHEVAADGRHVAQLRRRPRQQRLRQHRQARTDSRVVGDVAVSRQRADADRLRRRDLLDRRRARQSGQIDQARGRLDPQLHEVDQRGPAADERRPVGPARREGGRLIGRAHVAKRLHGFRSPFLASRPGSPGARAGWR